MYQLKNGGLQMRVPTLLNLLYEDGKIDKMRDLSSISPFFRNVIFIISIYRSVYIRFYLSCDI